MCGDGHDFRGIVAWCPLGARLFNARKECYNETHQVRAFWWLGWPSEGDGPSFRLVFRSNKDNATDCSWSVDAKSRRC
jgi:hypothetical protein